MISKRHTILVIDDDENLRCTLALILERAGFRVHTAAYVKEALRYLNNNPYDLIILDIKMPHASGLTLLPILGEEYPDTSLLILTAYPSADLFSVAEQMGASDYLTKPVDPAQIVTRINRILAAKEG